MAWNTALDGQGNTYYWHSQTGTTQYEKPADFDPTVAQDAGSYAAYQQPQAQTQPRARVVRAGPRAPALAQNFSNDHSP